MVRKRHNPRTKWSADAFPKPLQLLHEVARNLNSEAGCPVGEFSLEDEEYAYRYGGLFLTGLRQ